MRNAVLGRLRQASYGSDGRHGGAVARRPADGVRRTEELDTALAYAKSPIAAKAPLTPPRRPRHRVLGTGLRRLGPLRVRRQCRERAARSRGLHLAASTRASASNGRAGIAAGYTGSRNSLDGRGSANVETAHVAAYGGWSFGALNLRAGGALRAHTIDTDRTIAFPGFFDRATAHYDGRHRPDLRRGRLRLRVRQYRGRAVRRGAWVASRLPTRRPSARRGRRSTSPATTFETGYSTLGVRAASMIPLADDMVLIPRASLGLAARLRQRDAGRALAFQAPARASRSPACRSRATRCSPKPASTLRSAATPRSASPISARSPATCRTTPPRASSAGSSEREHDPEKACPGLDPGCAAVFGKDHAPPKT